jgi:putative tryptophan/tyrosine transport system substrate-binding protein
MTRAWVGVGVLACALVAAWFTFDPPRHKRIPRIGFLGGADSGTLAPHVAAMEDGLRVLGYRDGKSFFIESRYAQGNVDRLPALAMELVAAGVDVIVAASPPAVQAARGVTTTIPIVMLAHDPVEEGFAESLARPGGNITGIAFQDAELATKRLDRLRQAVPNLDRIAVVWNRAGGRANATHEVESAARALGMQVLVLELTEPDQFDDAIAAASKWGAQGVIQLASVVLYEHRTTLLKSLRNHRLPATCEVREWVIDGCLMTYSADYVTMFRHLAKIVDEMIKGIDPATRAIEQPREFDFVVNAKTA